MEFLLLAKILLLFSIQHVKSASTVNGLTKELADYLNQMKVDLEKAYEAKLGALEEKFIKEITDLRNEFNAKEDYYRARIDALEKVTEAKCAHVEDRSDSASEELREGVALKQVENVARIVGFGANKRRSRNMVTKRQLSVEPENRVAFFASVSRDLLGHLGANQDIVFDKVVTNLGSAYNGHHGTFLAPVSGTYVFFTTLHASGAETWGHFMVNGVIVAKIHLKGVQSSQTVIAHLHKGDDVSIQNTSLNKGLRGDMYSTFGGFLLFEDMEDMGSQIVGK